MESSAKCLDRCKSESRSFCVKTTVLCTLTTDSSARQPVCTPDTALTLLLPLKVRLQPEHDGGGGRQVPEEGVEGVHQDDQRLVHLRAPGLNFTVTSLLSCNSLVF